MKQAVWKRKNKNNDHRDIGAWSPNGRWYHFLEKGETCLGHTSKGDWICHNHKGKETRSKAPKKKKPKPVQRKGIKKKQRQNLDLLTRYQSKGGFKVLEEDLRKLKRQKEADRQREEVKKRNKPPRLGTDKPIKPKERLTVNTGVFGLSEENLEKLKGLMDKL